MDGTAVKSAFAFTFDESNKAGARKPRSAPISGADMTNKREGNKEIDGYDEKYKGTRETHSWRKWNQLHIGNRQIILS